jgi:hypothetical protein
MSGDGLVAPLNAPAAALPTPGVQPGTTQPVVIANLVIIFGPTGKISGLFVYQPGTTPAAGNPPIAWIAAASADPYGNTIQPGMFLAELASSGNALAGLLWNTIVGSEPLLALFPDATVGFSGNSPFILGRVFNRGAVNELLSLAMGGGGTAGTGSPVQVEAFSQSKDGTVLGHVSFYDWASTDLICDVNVDGIIAADPDSANTLETWHAISLDSGWSVGAITPSYRLLPDGNLQLKGQATRSGIAGSANVNNGHPLPAAYRPPGTVDYYAYETAFNRAHMSINSSGVITASSSGTVTGTWYAEMNTVITLT